jgi:protein-S-isoprenylcysteine O-methyltransferase Ste14
MFTVARDLPLIGIAFFFAVGFVWRPWLQYRRHGTAGVILFRSLRIGQAVRDGLFLLMLALVVAQVIVWAARPDLFARTMIGIPINATVQLSLGAVLMFGGTVLMAAAQLHLGRSWRIGIDEGAAPGLITGGLYRISRNPIFLGMFVTLIGLAVLLPTALSLIVVVVSFLCVRAQVREEEVYLLRTYGDDYRAFAGRVGRFVPGAGTLR